MTGRALDFYVPPGGLCEDCGHLAARHCGHACQWPQRPCPCTGMVWEGARYEIDQQRGAVAVIGPGATRSREPRGDGRAGPGTPV